jgi:hypothetical protein
MSEVSQPPSMPPVPELGEELAREERTERWIFIRQLAIAIVLIALLSTHALLA